MFEASAFAGKKIIVTGASSGVGRSTAILLSQLGACVVLVGRNEERLHSTLDKMVAGNHIMMPFDLLDFDNYDTLIEVCCKNGKVDGLVHCAGIAKVLPLKAIGIASIRETMDTNFTSFMLFVKYLSKKRFSNDGSSFIAVSSTITQYPQKCMSVYAASKAALEAAVRALALELYGRKIRINTLILGPIATPMAGFPLDSDEGVGMHSEVAPNLMGLAHPRKVAEMAAFLLSDACSYTTGRNFYVDGGKL